MYLVNRFSVTHISPKDYAVYDCFDGLLCKTIE